MVTRLRILFLIGVMSIVLSSCSIWSANKWNSFKVMIEVQSLNGSVIEGAIIQYDSNANLVTDNNGRASLYYSQGGLHLVIVKANGMRTKQLKIKMPNDVDKIVVLKLKKKD